MALQGRRVPEATRELQASRDSQVLEVRQVCREALAFPDLKEHQVSLANLATRVNLDPREKLEQSDPEDCPGPKDLLGRG